VADLEQARVEALIAKWEPLAGGAEKANFAPFIYDLIDALDLPKPEPAQAGKLGRYQFEGPIPKASFRNPENKGSADLYLRGHFIMEAKQSYMPPIEQRAPELFGEDAPVVPISPAGARYDRYMSTARAQVENYAKNLPQDEPTAPFLIVCDIGRAFEILFDFAGNGRGYSFFPDKTSYRIPLARLRDPEIRALLRDIWVQPDLRNPRLKTAEVTRQVAERLAKVSEWLEATQRQKTSGLSSWEQSLAVEQTALFLMRVIFCMFAEDVGLLPQNSFTDFLEESIEKEEYFERGLQHLWAMMDTENGDRWSSELKTTVRYFNGGLFQEQSVYRLGKADRGELLAAAEHEWKNVEPAIFGTLLEQALTPEERGRLGAHYTPRVYVERLVDATIMDVLRLEWEQVQKTLTDPELTAERGLKAARSFHDRLANVTVLDPACGTGNFLYVAMEAIERLEAEVIEVIQQLSDTTVHSRISPAQFYGLELNERAARIAELVLWIGWLRFRIRTDPESVTDPILARGAHINFGRHGAYDAVLQRTESSDYNFEKPVSADWPAAEFIVGNPPFIGKGAKMRKALGQPYLTAMWQANPRVPKSANYVMQWWDRAAHLLCSTGGKLRRFGFVTTNTISQPFNRRVIERYLNESVTAEDRLSLVYAVPDHPWTKGSGAAMVRIAMTVAERGVSEGRLDRVVFEDKLDTDAPVVELDTLLGTISSKLTVGTDTTRSVKLQANEGIATNGVLLAGRGFVLSGSDAELLRQKIQEPADIIRPYLAGSELMQKPKNRFVIDFSGLSESEAGHRAPAAFQHLFKTVASARKKVADDKQTPDAISYAERWWLFAKQRTEFRLLQAQSERFIATTETTKFRVFQFVDSKTVTDHMIVGIALQDFFSLGVLSSSVHFYWTMAKCGMMGVATIGQGHRYTKSEIFDTFPFPDATCEVRSTVSELARDLEDHRRAALIETPGLTMTDIYNWRKRIAEGEQLEGANLEKATAARAFIVHHLHEQIDDAVLRAYGWPVNLSPTDIVNNLMALNAERATEEHEGRIRWLRPEYQEQRFGKKK
jgi:hypothetical protein